MDFFSNQEKGLQERYIELLSVCASFSNLFSDSDIPFLYYRTHENIFCEAFEAINVARDDISIDAKKQNIGIGLKTFLHANGKTFQKIAEFDKQLKNIDVSNKLDFIKAISDSRNKRIAFAKNVHNLENLIYHLTTREDHKLLIFEEPMDMIDVDNLKINKSSNTSILFNDGINEYNFNFSKSTLLKRFVCPQSRVIKSFEVNILEKPFNVLLNFHKTIDTFFPEPKHIKQKDYIVLPLYNPRNKDVEKRSGLNQWNANGRKRNENEVYIPIPSWIHKVKNNFFTYNTNDYKTLPFTVLLPDGKKLSMKVCQSGGKALMSNPNSLLGIWILREVLNIPVGTPVTRELLDIIGIDSIKLTKMDANTYKMSFLKTGSFELFERMYRRN